MAAIRPSEVQALVQRLATELAPSTVEVIYGRVVAVFRAAVRDRIVTTSPCVDIRKPAKPLASMLEVLSRDHVFALAEAMPERYRALVLAGAGTGLRPGELFGLTVDRVDFLGRSIRVDRSSPGSGATAWRSHHRRRRRRTAEFHSRLPWPTSWPPT
jgi:integrase